MRLIARTPDDLPRIGRAIRDMLKAGAVAVGITEYKPTRTLEQNDKLHAICSDISKQRQWAGVWLDTEEWKRLLTAAWCRAHNQGAKILPALDGQGFDVLYQRTSKLSVQEMSELIEFAQWWAAENEVRLAA